MTAFINSRGESPLVDIALAYTMMGKHIVLTKAKVITSFVQASKQLERVNSLRSGSSGRDSDMPWVVLQAWIGVAWV